MIIPVPVSPPPLSIYTYADAAPLLPSGILRIRRVDFNSVALSSLNRHATAVLADLGDVEALCLCLQVQCVTRAVRQIAKWRRTWTFGSIASCKPVFLGTQFHRLFSNGMSLH
ncbi:hypothetical protein K438DRAFT_2021314 [Mycena galopus ATCC 62051]|nr:hypothetical protein K438DRAFT_2021314 [Mycena galopus ATCC 62051]